LIIAVTELGKSASGVRVDIYLEIEHGERIYWTGLTGSDGMAKPTSLLPGSYRVFAEAGKQSATMSLLVGEYKSNAVSCELKISSPDSTEPRAAMPDEPAKFRLREFRGVVEDKNKALIRHAIVRVLRADSPPEGYVAEFQADGKGRFALHLDQGDYVATFDYQGFRKRIVAFHLGNDGWQGVEVAMIADDSSSRDPPASEWKAGR
jgi:hypothetical protein